MTGSGVNLSGLGAYAQNKLLFTKKIVYFKKVWGGIFYVYFEGGVISGELNAGLKVVFVDTTANKLVLL